LTVTLTVPTSGIWLGGKVLVAASQSTVVRLLYGAAMLV
jgi:hypothetical protein